MFDDTFFEGLPDDPIIAGHKICEKVSEFYKGIPANKDGEYYENYLEAFGIFQAFSETYGLDIEFPKLVNEEVANITIIVNFFSKIAHELSGQVTNIKVSNARNKFIMKFGKAFSYVFTDGDYKRIQSLINELREKITESSFFEPDHKRRLFKKLEGLQYELHKSVSDLDKFWGLIGEAGVVLGKFGNDAKPFVDRIKEIAQIVWRTQARAEELPSSSPLPILENKDGNDSV